MTFLEEIKEELENIRVKKSCCTASEIRGMLIFGGGVFQDNAIFGTDNLNMAKRLSSGLRRACNLNYSDRLDEGAESYKFLIPEEILHQLSLSASENVWEFENKEIEACCMHAFVRGAFLAAGSVAAPEKAYRMEIFTENERAADKLFDILAALGVDAKKTVRKNLYIVYTNNSESVSDMIKATEASMAVFRVLEAKIIKDKRNETNRIINCDMANADRVSDNSFRETHAIRIICDTIGLDALKPKLREAAMLRLANESSSIKELAEMCEPPVPKSTMNNRLNKLIQIAKELGE